MTALSWKTLTHRAAVLNMNQFNGKFGCPLFRCKGEVVPSRRGRSRIYTGVDFDLRNNEEMLSNAESAVTLGVPVFVLKGPTWVNIIPELDLSTSFSPDYMHCIVLGVVRHFLFLWLDSINHLKEWYLGR